MFYVIMCAFIASSCSSEKKQETVENLVVNNSPDTTVNLHPEMDKTPPDDSKEEQKVSNTTDWDTAIYEYEEYIDDYIKFIKKGKAGDATAMLDAIGLMGKAESVSKKLENAKDQLTTKQMIRFSKIQTKILEAAR